ncbi:MAG: hypothetical protein M3R24_03000, partial [Chloroflexota bacterium]|nr:hypothetical protein [Chloroflexota bacterium]
EGAPGATSHTLVRSPQLELGLTGATTIGTILAPLSYMQHTSLSVARESPGEQQNDEGSDGHTE